MRELYNFLPLSNKQDPPIKGSNTDPADCACVGLKGLVPEDSSLPYGKRQNKGDKFVMLGFDFQRFY